METQSADTGAQIIRRLLNLMGRIHHALVRSGANHGLSPAQAVTLWSLEEPQAMKDIANLFGCDPSNVTGLVDRLESQDLVRRTSAAADRRVKLIELTEEGAKIRRAVEDGMEKGLCPSTELSLEDQQQLLGLLQKIQHD
ncbi:MAG: MarR family transcriptional regulator [Actinomycetia bacterium]|nr:MarR family transcriptional regulator [Actinomycetes bacterium]